jgi:hypothetical protein
MYLIREAGTCFHFWDPITFIRCSCMLKLSRALLSTTRKLYTKIQWLEPVTSQNVGHFRGRLEGLLCIASEITGFFHAFASKT